MLNKFFYFINKCFKKKNLDLKKEDGFTIVEVVIALLIISIITVVLVRGTMISAGTLKVNRAKTEALAVASEKLELIRAMDYEDIEYTADDPDWGLDNPILIEDGYDISYEITSVYEGDSSYKQLKISIFKEPMNVPIDVITQIYPVKGVEEEYVEHPPPVELGIEYDNGYGVEREIKLVWGAPNTELEINKYNIYRGGVFIASAFTEIFIDIPGNNNVYSYYVTAVYEDGVESGPSNVVNTAGEYEYPPPQELYIVKYTQGGNARTVHLAWEAPDTQLTIIRYAVYRGGVEVEVDWTGETSCSHRIGKINYTFYVRAVYEGNIFSDPSNEVETE